MAHNEEHPVSKKAKMDENSLEQLKKITVVVADTGELNSIKAYSPEDATTNPSLIYKASGIPEYNHIIEDAVIYAVKHKQPTESNSSVIDIAMDRYEIIKRTSLLCPLR